MDVFYAMLPVLFNFALVLVVLYFSMRKPAVAFLLERNRSIASMIAEGEKLSEESSKFLNIWENNWKVCEAHSKQMFDETKAMLAKVRTSTLEKAKVESERIQRDAKVSAEAEALRAKRMLQQELADKSIELAKNYLQKNINDEDRKKVVGEYVESLGNGHSR